MSYITIQLHVADFSCRFLNKNDKKNKYHHSFHWCRCSVVCAFYDDASICFQLNALVVVYGEYVDPTLYP